MKLGLNVPEEVILNNLRVNIEKDIPQLEFFERQDQELIIAAGGYSLKSEFEKLKQLYESGIKVVSVNGSHDWLIERGIEPSIHIQLDARPSNVKFTQNPIHKCKYWIGSQSPPEVFDSLKGFDVNMWHACSIKEEKEILDEKFGDNYWHIKGGSTVVLRGFMLLMALGFYNFHVFGFDSCVIKSKHHAYPQSDNDREPLFAIKANGKLFRVTAWMWSQAMDFLAMSKTLGQHYNLIVYGDGLISNLIELGFNLQTEQDYGSNRMGILQQV